jgi:hypothetical protein
MCKIADYENLKKEFGLYGSWAIWANGKKHTDGIGDWSVLTDENILSKAKPSYVFVGLNAAEHDQKTNLVPWCNFHSKDSKQKDYKLRCALQSTNYWGAYMTDIIKGYRCTKSEEVMKFVKNNPQKYNEHLDNFRKEMRLLAGEDRPILIAMGGDAYKLLRPLKKEFVIKKIPHYAARYKYSNLNYYVIRVHEILL